MALSSQTRARSGGGGISGGRRRRRRRGGRGKQVLVMLGVAVVAWIGWSMFFGGGPADAPDPDEVAVAPDDTDADEERSASRSGYNDVDSEFSEQDDASSSEPPDVFSPTPPRNLAESRDDDEPDDTATERDPEDDAASESAASDERDTDETDDASSSRRHRSSAGGERSEAGALDLMQEGQALYEDDELVEARAVLNTALTSGGLSDSDARDVRDLMAQINETLVFSPRIDPDDPFVEGHEVQPGDRLSAIANGYDVPWQMVADVNDVDPRRIRVGQTLKMIKGPFHVRVHKRDYRLDVFLGDMYVRSFPVGLGEHDMTPKGEFIVRNSKLENPEWTNPRTGERYLPDDPENPLGGYWIGIRGTTEESAEFTGYGIHGTIEPDTIGTDASMGCIRLLPSDVEQLYRMLEGERSRVVVSD